MCVSFQLSLRCLFASPRTPTIPLGRAARETEKERKRESVRGREGGRGRKIEKEREEEAKRVRERERARRVSLRRALHREIARIAKRVFRVHFAFCRRTPLLLALRTYIVSHIVVSSLSLSPSLSLSLSLYPTESRSPSSSSCVPTNASDSLRANTVVGIIVSASGCRQPSCCESSSTTSVTIVKSLLSDPHAGPFVPFEEVKRHRALYAYRAPRVISLRLSARWTELLLSWSSYVRHLRRAQRDKQTGWRSTTTTGIVLADDVGVAPREPRSRTWRAPVPPAWCDRRDYLAARRGGGGREAEEESRESATTELNRPANGSVYGVCCFQLSAGFAPASVDVLLRLVRER